MTRRTEGAADPAGPGGYGDGAHYSGAFHDVWVRDDLVTRVVRGAGHAARAASEWRTLDTIGTLDLGIRTPHGVTAPTTTGDRTSYVISRVPGESAGPDRWVAARDAYARVLTALWAAPTALDLPAPRAWCGGAGFRALVARDLAPRLGAQGATALAVVDALLQTDHLRSTLVHGDFGPHNILWRGDEAIGLIDWDHACIGDPAIDVAPLIGTYGAAAVREMVPAEVVDRALHHRATLSLQVAAAAHRVGDGALRDHALHNFAARANAGTLHDPGGESPR